MCCVPRGKRLAARVQLRRHDPQPARGVPSRTEGLGRVLVVKGNAEDPVPGRLRWLWRAILAWQEHVLGLASRPIVKVVPRGSSERKGNFENGSLRIVAPEVCPRVLKYKLVHFFSRFYPKPVQIFSIVMPMPVCETGLHILLFWIEIFVIYIVAFRTAFT
jgi:hypothetical protein